MIHARAPQTGTRGRPDLPHRSTGTGGLLCKHCSTVLLESFALPRTYNYCRISPFQARAPAPCGATAAFEHDPHSPQLASLAVKRLPLAVAHRSLSTLFAGQRQVMGAGGLWKRARGWYRAPLMAALWLLALLQFANGQVRSLIRAACAGSAWLVRAARSLSTLTPQAPVRRRNGSTDAAAATLPVSSTHAHGCTLSFFSFCHPPGPWSRSPARMR